MVVVVVVTEDMAGVGGLCDGAALLDGGEESELQDEAEAFRSRSTSLLKPITTLPSAAIARPSYRTLPSARRR